MDPTFFGRVDVGILDSPMGPLGLPGLISQFTLFIRHQFSSAESKECLLLNDFNTFKVRSHCEVLETLQNLSSSTLRALAPAIVFGTIYSLSATITKDMYLLDELHISLLRIISCIGEH